MKKTIKLLLVIAVIISSKSFYAQSCFIDAGNNQVICCGGGNVLLVASSSATACACPNVSYQWTPTVGLSSPTNDSTIASPTVTTMYHVCVTYYTRLCSPICCQACDSVLITVNNSCCRLKATNMNGIVRESSDISVYPNPAKTNLTIDVKKALINTEISVLDVTGRLIWQNNVTPEKSKFEVDVANLPRGIYFVKAITDGSEVYSGKLILE